MNYPKYMQHKHSNAVVMFFGRKTGVTLIEDLNVNTPAFSYYTNLHQINNSKVWEPLNKLQIKILKDNGTIEKAIEVRSKWQ